jgi:hypothetical protein
MSDSLSKEQKEQQERANDLWQYINTECQLAYKEGLPIGVILGVVQSYMSTLVEILEEVNG